MKHYLSEAACLAAALMTATSPAYAVVNTKECAAIMDFNAKAPSRAAMKNLPCRCLEAKERVDKVYLMDRCLPNWKLLRQTLNATPLAHANWDY
jgi:hypothetical protein